jgi:hypothetical protein
MPDDYESTLRQNWFRRQIEKGLISPDASELTRARIGELIEDGIARARKKMQPSPSSRDASRRSAGDDTAI